MPDTTDLVNQAVERICAAADADGFTASAAIDVVRALHAVRTGKGTGDVNLTGDRRRLAHVVGSAMHDHRFDPDQLRQEVIAKLAPNQAAIR
ncbi:hypothetical protein [Amycolatopsis sp. cmx-4-61]|uniref:hypothetical protein n=1 Tax=Amycolatopsis sp. cmx-4-61 TaxID=2790937 RepID=UPI003979936D